MADVGSFVTEKPRQPAPPIQQAPTPQSDQLLENQQQALKTRGNPSRFVQTVKAVMRNNEDGKQGGGPPSPLSPRRQSIRPGGTTDIWALVARHGPSLHDQGQGARPLLHDQGPGGRRPSQWMRRPSVAGSHSRVTGSGSQVGSQRGAQYENSYRLGPERVLEVDCIRKVVEQVLESYLCGEPYDARRSVGMATQLSDVIKARVKDAARLARHKVVCCVLIGQAAGQGVAVTSRCLWDDRVDNFVDARYESGELFAVATVYAVYCE